MSFVNTFAISPAALDALAPSTAGKIPAHWFNWSYRVDSRAFTRICILPPKDAAEWTRQWAVVADLANFKPGLMLAKTDRLLDYCIDDSLSIFIVEPTDSDDCAELAAFLAAPDDMFLEMWGGVRLGHDGTPLEAFVSPSDGFWPQYAKEVERWCSLPEAQGVLKVVGHGHLLRWPDSESLGGMPLLRTADFQGLDLVAGYRPGKELRFELRVVPGTGVLLDADGRTRAYGLLSLCESEFLDACPQVVTRLAELIFKNHASPPREVLPTGGVAWPTPPLSSPRASRFAGASAATRGKTQPVAASARSGPTSSKQSGDLSARRPASTMSRRPYASRPLTNLNARLDFYLVTTPSEQAFELQLDTDSPQSWMSQTILKVGDLSVRTAAGRRITDPADFGLIKDLLDSIAPDDSGLDWRLFLKFGLQQEWLDDMTLAFAANLLRAHPTIDEWDEDGGFHTRSQRRRLITLVSDYGRRLGGLTFSTLSQLAGIPDAHWQIDHDEDVDIGAQVSRAKRRWSTLRGEEVTDSVIGLHASGVAVLTAKGATPFSVFLRWASLTPSAVNEWSWRTWKETRDTLLKYPEVIQACDHDLVCANDSSISLASRIRALEQVFRRVSDTCDWGLKQHDPQQHWLRLMKQTMNRLFVWPLLAGTDQERKLMTGLSLPIGLMIKHDGRDGVRFERVSGLAPTYCPPASDREKGYWTFSGAGLAWDQNWHESLQIGWTAARRMWESQNRRALGQPRPATLAGTSLVVDLGHAAAIVDRAISDGTCGYLLQDSSVQACVAQSALALLLPRGTLPSAAITGAIGGEDENPDELCPVDGIDLKLDFVARSGQFDRVCLPDDERTRKEVRAWRENPRNHGAVEINHCYSLRSAADAMQPSGWRRARFTRTPVAQQSFFWQLRRLNALDSLPQDADGYDQPEQWQQESAEPLSQIEMLRLNKLSAMICGDSPIRNVNIQESLWTRSYERQLGEWLAWIDHLVRSQEWTRTSGNRAGLGIVVMRLAEEDNEMRFWASLFDALGADADTWNSFKWSSPPKAASVLASLLTGSRSRGSEVPPDLVVLIDEAGHTRRRVGHFADDFRGQMFDLLCPSGQAFLALEAALTDSGGGLVELGGTRILVLHPNDATDFSTPHSHRAHHHLVPPVVEQLSVFRYAFTAHQAAAMLTHLDNGIPAIVGGEASPLDWSSMRDQLDDMCTRVGGGWLSRHRGRYFLTPKGRLETCANEARMDPYLQFAAGQSFAPIIASGACLLGVNRDRAFEHEEWMEATWHLRRTQVFSSQRLGSEWATLRAQASNALEHLVLTRPTQDWDTVIGLLARRPMDAYELAGELLVEELASGKSPHASRYALALKTVARLHRAPEVDQSTKESAIAQAWAWYLDGLARAGDHLRSLTILRSEYANVLRSSGADWDSVNLFPIELELVKTCEFVLSSTRPEDLGLEIAQGWFTSFTNDRNGTPHDWQWTVARAVCRVFGSRWDACWMTLFGLAPDLRMAGPDSPDRQSQRQVLTECLCAWQQAFPGEDADTFRWRLMCLVNAPVAQWSREAVTALKAWIATSRGQETASLDAARRLLLIAKDVGNSAH